MGIGNIMKSIKTVTITTISLILLFVSGCVAKDIDPEVMYQKGAHLTKLTRKVQVAVHHGVTDEKVLYSQALEKYPQDMSEFSDYSLKMKNDNGTAVILLCNAEKTKALLEDAACTGELEGGTWFEKNYTCTFHLNINHICRK